MEPVEGIGECDVSTRDERALREKQMRKRAIEELVRDDTQILCKRCGLPRLDRVNLNRMALDSDDLGSHFESMDTLAV
jgi:hypothetical protein